MSGAAPSAATVPTRCRSSWKSISGAALTADLAWLIGAAFAPLVALALSARFGLEAVSLYLLSGAVCTLVALRTNVVAAAVE